MGVPNPFQKLKHGVLLCGKNFKTFVETFNFLIDFVRNLSGDGDNGGPGKIKVDRSVPDRPIIRFDKSNGAAAGEDDNVTSIIGDTLESEAAKGNVHMTGGAIGLTVKTTAATEDEEGEIIPAKVELDLDGREESESDWGIHALKYRDAEGEEQTVNIFAAEDVTIPNGGTSNIEITATSHLPGIPFSASKSVGEETVTFDLVIGENPEEDPSAKGGENYCNSVSEEGGEGNFISDGSGGPSGAGDDNTISHTPCTET